MNHKNENDKEESGRIPLLSFAQHGACLRVGCYEKGSQLVILYLFTAGLGFCYRFRFSFRCFEAGNLCNGLA